MVTNTFNVHYYERYVNLETGPALPRIEGDYRKFFDGHVLGIRGGDPRLRPRTGAVLHTTRSTTGKPHSESRVLSAIAVSNT
jgi:hypothetical protein